MSTDNIRLLRINSRYPNINSGIPSYSRYYICNVSDLTFLFKNKCRKYQLQSYYMYFSCLLLSWGSHNLEIGIFLLLPLLTAINLYLQLCHYYQTITFLPLFFYSLPIYSFALTLGPSFLLYRVIPRVRDITPHLQSFFYMIQGSFSKVKCDMTRYKRSTDKSEKLVNHQTTSFFLLWWYLYLLRKKESWFSL